MELGTLNIEGLMLQLKLQYFGHPMRTADSLEKTLMLGKIEGRRRKGRRRMRWLIQWNELGQTWGDGKGLGSWRAAVQGVVKSPTGLGD